MKKRLCYCRYSTIQIGYLIFFPSPFFSPTKYYNSSNKNISGNTRQYGIFYGGKYNKRGNIFTNWKELFYGHLCFKIATHIGCRNKQIFSTYRDRQWNTKNYSPFGCLTRENVYFS